MDELIVNLKGSLYSCCEFTEVILNALSLLAIITGVLVSFFRSTQERQRTGKEHPMHTFFRRTFGGWLIVALEFQLAADIVGTIAEPTYRELIQLGAIALIRTFLNYFLGKELREESERLESRKVEAKTEVA